MKQIVRIEIINFQCHARTVVEPATSGLTVITGPTDHGKSAVVRALRWLFYNRPQGDEFIRHGENECRVIATMPDGTTVMRRRTKSLNQYYVNDELYEGFGNDVPLEVQQALGVYSYQVAGETLNLNIAEQLAGPFLGSSISAPTRAKILGKLAGTEAIDRANKTLGTDIYHAKQDKKRLEDEIEGLEKKIDEYDWVPVLGANLRLSEKMMKEIEENRERKLKLEKIFLGLDHFEREKRLLEFSLRKLGRIGEAQSVITDIIEQQHWLDILSELFHELGSVIMPRKFQLGEKLERYSRLEEAAGWIADIEFKLDHSHDLNTVLSGLEVAESYKKSYQESLTKLEGVEQAAELHERLWENIHLLEKLDAVHDRLYQNQIRHETMQVIFEKLKQVPDAVILMESIHDSKKQLSELTSKALLHDDITGDLEKYREIKRSKKYQIEKAEEDAREARVEYRELLKESGICPTCGAETSEQNLERVI